MAKEKVKEPVHADEPKSEKAKKFVAVLNFLHSGVACEKGKEWTGGDYDVLLKSGLITEVK